MNYCPNCSYILDINKVGNVSKVNIKNIYKPSELFKLLDNDIELSYYKIQFPLEELYNSKKYTSLSEDKKAKLDSILSDNTNIKHTAEFKCINCLYTSPILNTVLLYEDNTYSNLENTNTLAENKLLVNNPALPHTRDYICKNAKCPTLNSSKDNIVEKDAIFFKKTDTYKINYICCVCYYKW